MTVRIVPSGPPDAISKYLFSEGASSIQESDGALLTSFPEAAALSALKTGIISLDPHAEVTLGPPRDLTVSLHGTVTSHIVGSLVIAPPWEAALHPADRTVVIQPGGAFGTGEHPTTRGVLRLMQHAVKRGDLVADLGAGSAVLAIAAAKLGAARVAAIELDESAIANAEENVAANGVEGIIGVVQGDARDLLPLLAPVNLVLANIVSGAVIELLPVVRRSLAPEGAAIVGGILQEERPRMLEAFSGGAWSLEKEDFEEEWWSALIAPR